MAKKPLLAFGCALAVLVSVGASAWGQTAPARSARAMDLDAAPSTGSAPDPLTPAEGNNAAPAAPGAPVLTGESKPAEADPIVAKVRQQLATQTPRGNAGERDDLAGLKDFYESTGQPVWNSKDGFTARAKETVAEIRKAEDWGLKAAAFDLPAAPDAPATLETLADTEIRLGLAVLKYGRHARGGRLDPRSVSRIFDQKPAIYDPKTLMQAIAVAPAADAYLRALHPKHPQFERLRKAMLAARSARPDDPIARVEIPDGPQIKAGQEHAHVALVRERLAVASAAGGQDAIYDEALVAAVKAYQRQRRLQVTGLINAATRKALNDTGRPSSRDNVQRLIVNMERWRWMPENLGAFYVWDSVPEQMTMVFDEGKRVLAEKIVIGKPSSPTPVFSADMLFVIFHPSWGVPPGMKAHELWPQLRSSGGGWFSSNPTSSAVLNAHGLRVSRGGVPVNPDSINWSNVDIRSFDFTQPPGPRNVLGIVKFRFPNKHDVYMHDTPERHLFGGAVRAFSHGCMRVQNPVRLAEVLLAHDKGWGSEKVAEYVRRGGEIKLTTPIPVHITYFTAAVDDDGKVDYRSDIYGLDGRFASALEGRAVHLLSAASASPEPVAKAARPVRAQSRARKKAAEPSLFDLFTSGN